MKEAYYFPHDCNAIQDPKLMQILIECGPAAIGIFWIVTEAMHSQCNGITTAQLAHLIRFYGEHGEWSDNNLKKIEKLFLETGLFFEKDGIVYSKRVLNNLKRRNELSKKGRENARARWGSSNRNATAMQPQCDPNAIKERKGNKRIPPLPPIGFVSFWSAYPKKAAKRDALKAWLKINPDPVLLQKILNAIFNQSKTDKWKEENGKFIPYPATWLNGGRWEDEVQIRPPSPKDDPNYEAKLKAREAELQRCAQKDFEERNKNKTLSPINQSLKIVTEAIKTGGIK